MQKYLIFSYKLKLNSRQQSVLDSVSTSILNPKEPAQKIIEEYPALSEQNNFQQMIISILKFVNAQALKLKNVFMVSKSISFFQSIIKEEFQRRNLIMPFVFKNNIDLLKVFCTNYNQKATKLEQIQEFFEMTNAETDFQLIQAIILRMIDLGTLFAKDSPTAPSEQSEQEQEIYFKTVGWPFQIRSAEIAHLLVQGKRHREDIQIFFVIQNNVFNGMVFLKSPAFLRKQILEKDRCRVGCRYIEIKEVQKRQLQICRLKYTITDENIKKFGKTFSNYSKNQTLPTRFQERLINKRRGRSRSSYSSSKSSNSSSKSQNRSRDISSAKRFQKLFGAFPSNRRRTYEIQDRNITGLRIRGLPFTYNERDVLDLLKRHYPLMQSVKMGHKDGRKSGEAVVLFESYKKACQSLEIDGLVVGRRYLQAILISLDDYQRFK